MVASAFVKVGRLVWLIVGLCVKLGVEELVWLERVVVDNGSGLDTKTDCWSVRH